MNNRTYLFGGISLTLVLIALLYLFYASSKAPVALAPTLAELPPATTTEVAQIVTQQIDTYEATTTPITVNTQLSGTHIVSPLVITGRIWGEPPFEPTFPVSIVDASGVTIAKTEARAEGQAPDFVPFSATLTWSSTSTTATSGVLILKRNNSSDTAQNKVSLEIPVLF